LLALVPKPFFYQEKRKSAAVKEFGETSASVIVLPDPRAMIAEVDPEIKG
jgi:hypothetical protein